MSNKVKKLPSFIQKIVKKRATTTSDFLIGTFQWKKTIEGHKIWADVYKDNYQPFYEFHVKLNKK